MNEKTRWSIGDSLSLTPQMMVMKKMIYRHLKRSEKILEEDHMVSLIILLLLLVQGRHLAQSVTLRVRGANCEDYV